MEPKCRAVLDAAMELSEDERALIADELLATLTNSEISESDEDFIAELERRAEEARNDPSATVPWSELRNKKP